MANKWLFRFHDCLANGLDKVITQTVFVLPAEFFLALFVMEDHFQTGAKYCLGAQDMFKLGNGEFVRVKVLLVRPESNRRTCIALAYLSYYFHL